MDQNWRTSSLKLSVFYKKDATIESDSKITKDDVTSLQDQMESIRTETKRQFVNDLCMIDFWFQGVFTTGQRWTGQACWR